MPLFNVLHASPEAMRDLGICFDDDKMAATSRKFRDDFQYKLVAAVVTDDINDVFRLTNHINSSWQDNEGVTALDEAVDRARSTSMGDIIIDEEGNGFIVAAAGLIEEIC